MRELLTVAACFDAATQRLHEDSFFPHPKKPAPRPVPPGAARWSRLQAPQFMIFPYGATWFTIAFRSPTMTMVMSVSRIWSFMIV